MKKNSIETVSKSLLVAISLFFSGISFAQQQAIPSTKQKDFWSNVQIGGGLGLSIGSGYTDITVSPSAIYNINPMVAVGTALQFGYVSSKNNYTSTMYGISLIGLFNPIPEVQLSAELEETYINSKYKYIGEPTYSDSFWNTALYLGAGYRSGNVTIGARYDVLFNKNHGGYYSDAFMPFVRVYF